MKMEEKRVKISDGNYKNNCGNLCECFYCEIFVHFYGIIKNYSGKYPKFDVYKFLVNFLEKKILKVVKFTKFFNFLLKFLKFWNFKSIYKSTI